MITCPRIGWLLIVQRSQIFPDIEELSYENASQNTNTSPILKSALIVGRDYPHPDGLDYVRRKWKEALHDPQNCQLIPNNSNDVDIAKENERILRKAVGKGRYVIREMEGTIQLKKYRTMRRRYGQVSVQCSSKAIQDLLCYVFMSNNNMMSQQVLTSTLTVSKRVWMFQVKHVGWTSLWVTWSSDRVVNSNQWTE